MMTLFKESEVATLLHIEGTWALLKEGNSSLETSWLERYEWEGCINLPKPWINEPAKILRLKALYQHVVSRNYLLSETIVAVSEID